MENVIIINIILSSIIGVGVLLYFVWLGSSTIKMKKQLKRLEENSSENFDDVYSRINANEEEASKQLDKLDSRFDRRLNEEVDSIHKSIATLEEHKKDKK